MAVPYFTGSTIFYIAYLIISSIQLGYFLGKGTIFSLVSYFWYYRDCYTFLIR
nr:hypothetical protein [uncultured Dorea sp.]